MSRAAQTLSLPFVGGLSLSRATSDTGENTSEPDRRVACVDIPELPLQMILRAHPTWRSGPAAVVTEDKPEAPLLFVNEIGWRRGLRPGMRYGEARNLVSLLRAASVLQSDVDALCAELTHALQTFSPRVESDETRRGVFYVDPAGLTRIYEDLQSWGEAISGYLKGRGFDCAVVVAHGRFTSFALARSLNGGRWVRTERRPDASRRYKPQRSASQRSASQRSALQRSAALVPVRVFESQAETQALLDRVPLDRLDLGPKLRDGLAQLAVTRVGDLRSVSAEALYARFGTEAGELRSLLSDDPKAPLNPAPPELPARARCEIDPPDTDHTRLLFAIKGILHELLQKVVARGEVLRALRVELRLEGLWRGSPEGVHEECITPARATRDLMTLLDLVRLRLAEVTLSAPVEAVVLEAEMEAVEGDQLVMFRRTARDLEAGARAIARVRAAFGERAVTRAKLKEAHLPEASFSWEPVQTVLLPSVPAPSLPEGRLVPPLIRCVFRHPKPLSTGPKLFLPDLLSSSPFRDRVNTVKPSVCAPRPPPSLVGPYRVSGGWWVREIERDYYYAETEEGVLLWLFYDRPRDRWFLHGVVD